ncbi:hypothetical protein GC197_12455 [bacterium]|nr:hypothetical protein [bacterium]
MSFEFEYLFQSPLELDELVEAFWKSLGIKFQPLEKAPTVYAAGVLGMGFDLTHSFVDEESPSGSNYPYCLSACVSSSESELLYIHPSLFFSTIYMMYRSMEIKRGIWKGDSGQVIAEYNFVCGDAGWHWYDLTHDCIAGYRDEFIEDYLLKVFPRSIRQTGTMP